jgi:hypothetical protein
MRDIALEVPLVLLALGGGGQGDDAGDTRIEPLHDALDGAALAGRIAALEQDHHLELLVDDPVLQTNQFMLQAEQFPEIGLTLETGFGLAGLRQLFGDQLVEALFLELNLEFFVETVGDLGLDALELQPFGGCVGVEFVVHRCASRVFGEPKSRFRRRLCDRRGAWSATEQKQKRALANN